jgi:hypothetical protein
MQWASHGPRRPPWMIMFWAGHGIDLDFVFTRELYKILTSRRKYREEQEEDGGSGDGGREN